MTSGSHCLCHECGCHSLNCTSPMDYISHHALHSHIPVHHYTNHTAVTIHSLVFIVSPHLHLIHSHTFKQHSHMHSLRSLVLPRLTFWALFILLSLCLTPDCPTLEFWTCACDLDPCLVLFTSLLCLWYSCSACWPLPDWFCLINIAASGSTRLWPVFTVCIFTSRASKKTTCLPFCSVFRDKDDVWM